MSIRTYMSFIAAGAIIAASAVGLVYGRNQMADYNTQIASLESRVASEADAQNIVALKAERETAANPFLAGSLGLITGLATTYASLVMARK